MGNGEWGNYNGGKGERGNGERGNAEVRGVRIGLWGLRAWATPWPAWETSATTAICCEGNARPSRADYLPHLGVANGSLRETESNLLFLKRRMGLSSKIDEALALCTTVARLLAGLIRALKGKSRRTDA
jgi:hypothetical protein